MTDININTSHAVYVLGDTDTCGRTDMLTAAAAEQGSVIGRRFAFAAGEASAADDLSTVGAVVEALADAVATRTDVWVPFWLQDLSREQHLRALHFTLRRHGLHLLLGQRLTPCPEEGGLNQLDAAVRAEIGSLYALDDAVMAAAGLQALGPEIEAALAAAAAEAAAEAAADPGPRSGWPRREPLLSTAQTAALLGKSAAWVSRGLREKTFVYADGTAVTPMRQPNANGHAFTVPMVQAIALSAYRRGTLDALRLEGALAELAGSAR